MTAGTAGDGRPTPVARYRPPGTGRAWPALPAALLLVGLFFLPLAIMVVYSFWTTNNNFQTVPDWTLKNYARFFQNPVYVSAFVKTLLMGAGVTLAGLLVAFPFAYFLVRYTSRRWQRILLLAAIVPFWTSYLLRVYAWEALLGPKGLLNQALVSIGLLSSESTSPFLYNNFGVFLVLLYVYFPFAVLSIYASLERFDFNLLRAAQDLGARPDQALRRILVPAIRPGLITACIFVFVPILGEYLTPDLVGGTEGTLVSTLIYRFFHAAQIPAGAAPSFLIALFVTIVLIVFRRYLRIEDVVGRG